MNAWPSCPQVLISNAADGVVHECMAKQTACGAQHDVVQASKRLEKERTRLLCLAKMPFDDSNLMHLRLLQSVYLSFVGGPGPVGRSVSQHCALVQMYYRSHSARDVCFCRMLFVHCKGTWTNWWAP